VADLNKMLAETDIDENDVVTVSLGDTAKISVDAYPDTTFLGLVSEIANTGTQKGTGTQEQVTNFLVKVSMIQKPATILPGMSSTVEIITKTKNDILKVPIQCVTMRKPLSADSTLKTPAAVKPKTGQPQPAMEDEKTIKVVFVVKNGLVAQVPVETGITSDTEWEITKGVAEGDEIVSGSYRILSKTLKNGDKVKIDNSLKRQFKENEGQK
jgi:HlyD family secretion protein